MTTKAEKKIVATIETKLGYEKKNVKGVVTSVRDYVVIGGNLWLNPAIGAAIVSRLEDNPAQFHKDLHDSVRDCELAELARNKKAKPQPATKATKAAESTSGDDSKLDSVLEAIAAQNRAIAFLMAKMGGDSAPASEPVSDEPAADKRETAKERADRLRERAE